MARVPWIIASQNCPYFPLLNGGKHVMHFLIFCLWKHWIELSVVCSQKTFLNLSSLKWLLMNGFFNMDVMLFLDLIHSRSTCISQILQLTLKALLVLWTFVMMMTRGPWEIWRTLQCTLTFMTIDTDLHRLIQRWVVPLSSLNLLVSFIICSVSADLPCRLYWTEIHIIRWIMLMSGCSIHF